MSETVLMILLVISLTVNMVLLVAWNSAAEAARAWMELSRSKYQALDPDQRRSIKGED